MIIATGTKLIFPTTQGIHGHYKVDAEMLNAEQSRSGDEVGRSSGKADWSIITNYIKTAEVLTHMAINSL